MRIAITLLALIAALVLSGCEGPTRKFGRGLNNFTELARGGEIRRSIEQTALWEGPEAAYTTGLIRGLNRTKKATTSRAVPQPFFTPVRRRASGTKG